MAMVLRAWASGRSRKRNLLPALDPKAKSSLQTRELNRCTQIWCNAGQKVLGRSLKSDVCPEFPILGESAKFEIPVDAFNKTNLDASIIDNSLGSVSPDGTGYAGERGLRRGRRRAGPQNGALAGPLQLLGRTGDVIPPYGKGDSR